MIVLIAESKTMRSVEKEILPEQYHAHTPSGEVFADAIMERLSRTPVPDICEEMKVSVPMARKILTLAYEFPNKSLGLPAIESYTGVVFKAFRYETLNEEQKNKTASTVRIISSLYGWLRPDDVIKQYRTDFYSPVSPDDGQLASFWRKDTTIQLVNDIKTSGDTVVLNLLPADAAKCIDWKLVKRFAKVWKVDFKQQKEGGGWKTPHAGLLKQLRGELLREIIKENISSPVQLESLVSESLIPLGSPDYPDRVAFYTC